MKSHRFLHEADSNVLAVVTLTVAAIFGTIGLAMSDDSLDSPQWSAVSSAHAVTPDNKGADLVAHKDATDAHATEVGSAVESAHPARSQAAR